MKSPLPRITNRTAFLALVFTIAPIAFAQRAPVAPTAPTAPKADAETVTLSPFTVSTDKDVGFVATSSLAGGRLAGNLADTPAAASAATRNAPASPSPLPPPLPPLRRACAAAARASVCRTSASRAAASLRPRYCE